MTSAAPPKGTAGFRPFRLVKKVVESRLITSFFLAPEDGAPLPPVRPGQFVNLRLPEAAGGVLRSYSLSGAPDAEGPWRISVKREPSAGPGLPAGVASGFLHDRVAVGDLLAVEGPRGAFVLDEESRRPVLLLSGGVGLTPMVAMLHRLAQTDRPALFLHGCEDGEVHALRTEVEALVASRPGLSAHVCYRTPTAADRAARRFDSEGIIDRTRLQALLPLDDYDVYLCGPPGFMAALYATLRGLGVAKERIAYEFFGPATVLDPDAAPPPPPAAAPVATADGAITVAFRKAGLQADWAPAHHSLLELAEAQGLRPHFSCRAGICGTCVTRKVSGEVAYFEEPLEELAADEVLLCCARPATALVLDL